MNATQLSLQTACPMCNAESQPSWEKFGHQLYECGNCQHLFCAIDPTGYIENTYDDAYFEAGGGGYTNYAENKTALIQQGKKYSRVLAKHSAKGELLDIGSAAGFLLKGIVEEGWKGTGIEPNRRMANFAQKEVGVNTFNTAFEDFDVSKKFNAVTLIQVLSHVRDPRSCLARINELLYDDGLLLIETWNRKSLTAKLFGKSWHQYCPPSVQHWYTKTQLADLLEGVGFDVIARGRPIKWISLKRGTDLVRHSLSESKVGRIMASPISFMPGFIKIPYMLDDVFWMLAKKRP